MKFLKFDAVSKREILKNTAVIFVSVAVSTALSVFLLAPSIQAAAKENSTITSRISKMKLFGDAENSLVCGGDIIADIAEDVAPSIVHINTEVRQTINGNGMEFFFENDEFFKRFFGFSPYEGAPRQPMIRKAQTMGSGTIISKDGYILTNYHVVQDASKITVKTKDEKEYQAKLVGKDRYSDLAIIKVDGKELKPAKLGDSSKIRPGQWAIAIGSPQGLDHTVTLGIVSALSREIPQLSNVSFIQTDAAINPGNSGGPLLNIKGEVIGINTAILGTAQNIGFAIPINVAKSVVDQLESGEKIGHPWIGISMAPVTKELAAALGISEKTQGVVVGSVLQNSPSEKAGLMSGDIIQRIDGQQVTSPEQVQAIIKEKKIGDSVNIQILRNGKMLAKKVKIGNWLEE